MLRPDDKNPIHPAQTIIDPEAIPSVKPDTTVVWTFLVVPEVLHEDRLPILDLSTLQIGESLIVTVGENVNGTDLSQMIDQSLEVVRGNYHLMLARISVKTPAIHFGMLQ